MNAKSLLSVILCCVFAAAAVAAAAAAAPAFAQSSPNCPSILDHHFKRLQDETPQHLCRYAGQVALAVNTASYCGYTHQYEGLEALYAKYKNKGFVILGFPSNDFAQEPGNSKQIAELCFNTYGVKFPMFAKTTVAGSNANALYAQLAKATGTPPKWNFHKYLIDRSGRVVKSYSSRTAPDDKTLLADIEQALAQPR